MNNKKSKTSTSTSVSDLVKPKKTKIEISVSDLIKSKKTRKQRKSIIIQDANPTKKRKRALNPNPNSFQQNNVFDLFNEETDSSQSNNNENIHTLFSSSPSLPNPSYFHIPAPDENKDNDEYIYYNEEEEENDEYIYYNEEEEENDDDEDDGDNDEDNGDENNGAENNDGEDEGDYNEDDDDDNDGNDEEEKDDIEEFFASPEFDNNEVFVMESLSDSINTEIIIWLFKFQQRFRLPDVALEALIKFLHIVLTRLNKSQFKNFPASLYLAKKMLNIFQPKMQLTVCNNCHKLYNVKNIVEYKEGGKTAIANCLHEEFPNNPVPSRRNKCNNPLSILKKKESGIIAEPRMIYPKPSIRQQLSMLYQRPGFENMLKLSGVQRERVNIYSDIYDGNVWKTFSFDGSPFFTSETATTNLGLLVNLDWFQPFTYTQHSTGAIYASICNLPRSERNKPENIIYLGFLPGPKEVGLDRINHYLAPIVDELLELWRGWRVPKTYHYPDGLDIKVALIVGSSDIPATRKLFGHGSALMKCHRCEKRSVYSEEYRKNHYGGVHTYELSNAESHRKHAYEWLQCNSKNSREDHFKEYGIRWSELLRLPYMDPIRFAVVDPMHCLFLGVAKWIIKSIFVSQGKLSMEQLRVAQNRMDHVKLPSDIGRIPPKIAIGSDGFSNLTADQWKTFIMIYSTAILWDMLDDNDRKILGYFVRACNLLVTRIITEDDLKEAQERLKDMAYLIENTYGPEFITSNIHLSLHIPDCCRDYGPIYSFWLFPFERLNGYIGSYPNSNRKIEPELMKIVLKNTLVDYHLTCKWTSGLLDESLCFLVKKKDVGSLALTAEREELQYFLSMRHSTSKIYGTEAIPGQLLKPSYLRVVIPSELRMFLCEWYEMLYEKDHDEILGFMDLQINQHARLQIGSEIFGSVIAGRHETNSTILAKWKAFSDETIDIYPGEVQYYFEHTLRLPEGSRTHLLAYVKWYKNAPSSDIRFKHRFIEPELSNTELWKGEYYEEGCDSLIAVHRILCRATKIRNIRVGKQNYISIMPLNRKFNL
ncbi:uncharacterized protein LOC107327733 [Rhizophagus irregularis DAOM 181602=DAOM 197198]|nr:uncharacterized protein LOC107327733 [Rhizophagus irregularis DAOM 181602=DAOM 197198]GET65249.1 uncharacterized protein LOC107327733 [Rhizophagus irregularis DAOM 181602=DAOM 197198]